MKIKRFLSLFSWQIEFIGDSDKRHLVAVLRRSELVEEFAGPDGRLRFATTSRFLDRFGLDSLENMDSLLGRHADM